jgi:hypothetical protein
MDMDTTLDRIGDWIGDRLDEKTFAQLTAVTFSAPFSFVIERAIVAAQPPHHIFAQPPEN